MSNPGDLTNIHINPNLCMSIKNKRKDCLRQCPNKKRIGDYCGIHGKAKHIKRIDELVVNMDISNSNDNSSNSNSPLNPLPQDKSIIILKKPVINRKYVLLPHKYLPDEFQNHTPESVDYNRLLKTVEYYQIDIQGGDTFHFFEGVKDFFNNRWIDVSGQKITPLLEELSGVAIRNKEICQNSQDFYDLINLNEISDIYFFSFKHSDKIYGCDIRSFHQLVENAKLSGRNQTIDSSDQINYEVINPYNRIPLYTDILDLYEQKKNILLQNRISMEYPKDELDEETDFKLKVLDTFQIIYHLGYPVDHEWFLQLNIYNLFAYYQKLEDIWNYRAELTHEQRQNIVPNEEIFTKDEVNTVSNIYRYDKKELRHALLNNIRKMIIQGKTKADRINGAIYVLTGLVEICPEAADTLPSLAYAAGIDE